MLLLPGILKGEQIGLKEFPFKSPDIYWNSTIKKTTSTNYN